MRELWLVCVNEWTKLVHRKRLWVCALLGLGLVVLFTYAGWHEQQNQNRFSSPAAMQAQISQLKEQIVQAKGSSDPGQKQMAQDLEQELQSVQTGYQQAEAALGPNWKSSLQAQVSDLKGQLAMEQAQPQVGPSAVGDIQGQIMKLEYSINHNLRPSPPWAVTPYQMLFRFLTLASVIFIPLITVILVADMVAGETTSGTVKLLLIRPVSRARILLGKWLVSLFGTAILTLAISFAYLGLGGLVLGFQGASDPMLVGTTYTFVRQPGSSSPMAVSHNDHAHVISMASYDVRAVLLMVLSMLVVATIAFLCSVLFQSAMAATAVALGVVIVGSIATELVHSHWIIGFFPVHLNLASEWTGDLARQLQMSVGLSTGLLVLGIWALVAIIVSFIRFTRRDVLNA